MLPPACLTALPHLPCLPPASPALPHLPSALSALCLPWLPALPGVQDYKEFLEDMLKPEDKNVTPFITDYKEYHTGGRAGGCAGVCVW